MIIDTIFIIYRENRDRILFFKILSCHYVLGKVGKSLNSTVVAGIFCAGGDTKFGFFCDTVVMWAVIIPVGLTAAFVLRLPVLTVYFLLNLDELIKLPAVYRHYRNALVRQGADAVGRQRRPIQRKSLVII